MYMDIFVNVHFWFLVRPQEGAHALELKLQGFLSSRGDAGSHTWVITRAAHAHDSSAISLDPD